MENLSLPTLALGLLVSNVANADGPAQSTLLETAQTCAAALKADRVAFAEQTRNDEINGNEIPYSTDSSGTYGYFALTDPSTGNEISVADTSDTTSVDGYRLTDPGMVPVLLDRLLSDDLKGDNMLLVGNTFLAQPNGTLYAYGSYLSVLARGATADSPLHHRSVIAGYDARDYRDNRGMAPYSPDTDKEYRSKRGLLVDVPKDELLKGGYAPETYHLDVLNAAQSIFTKELGKFTQACEAQRAFIQAQMPKGSK